MKKEFKDFFMYTYFGIVPEETYEKMYKGKEEYLNYCRKKAIIKAYSDATNQGAYNTLFKKEIPNVEKLKSYSKKAKKEAATILFEKIKGYEKECTFDNWHDKLCNEIIEKYEKVNNGPPFFTYGNAQKWANMSLKYMWILDLLPESFAEEELHMPIDRYIISALNAEENCNRFWSKWEKPDYLSFRQENEKHDLHWENRAWIETAETINAKEKQKIYESFFG